MAAAVGGGGGSLAPEAAAPTITPEPSQASAAAASAGATMGVGQLMPVLQSLVDALQAVVALLSGAPAATTPAPDAITTPTPSQPPPPPSTAVSSARAGVLLIGDSLTVGTRTHLTSEMVGAPLEVSSTGGISLAEGMRRYDAAGEKPRVVEMALFTNNSPGQKAELRAAIEKTVTDARARGGRVVWATIERPGGYDDVNALIRELATKHADVMGLVDWQQMVAANPSFLASDKVHGTDAGYKARAQAFADAAKL